MFVRKTPTPPTALRAWVAGYALGAFKVLRERVVVYALERTHWIDNQKFEYPF